MKFPCNVCSVTHASPFLHCPRCGATLVDVHKTDSPCIIELRSRAGAGSFPLVVMSRGVPVDEVISAEFTDGALRIRTRLDNTSAVQDVKLLEVYQCLEQGNQAILLS